MPHAELPTYRDGFFEKFLADLPGTPTLAQIEQQQPGQPAVLMGDYIEYSGPALTPIPNATITPQFAIQTGANGTTQTFVMLWVVERFDVATDSPETIARILADFRPATTTGTADASSVGTELARTWADALTAEGVRQALAKNLSEITAVPAGLPASDLDTLKTFLGHFGTYKADGAYYAKGAVAEGAFPTGVSAAYLAQDTGNLAEVKLPRDQFYCYALVSERLWNPQADASRVRQLVYRIEDHGADAPERWRLSLVHTVGATQGGPAASRFIFFHAAVGLGLAIPERARRTLDPTAAALLERLPERLANLPATLADPATPIVGNAQAPYILFIGSVTETFPASDLPEGVIADGEGAVRIFRCPPQHAMALADRPDIESLELSGSVYFDMQQAMAKINLAGRTFPAGITAANTGQGVVVGIIDSGIDGGHPAFLGRSDDPTKSRIHSVWNMWESGGSSPFNRSGSNAAYRAMNFGREYIGHDEVITAQDHPIGHGTHVSGIAAGRAVGTWPGGIAPAATLVVVSAGTDGGFVNDLVAGVKYCFLKATELNRPCVVNISLGTERHSHDGTDPLSIALTQLVSQNRVPASGLGVLPSVMPSYIEGRVICASAGNMRGDNTHWQASIPAAGEVSVLYQPFSGGANSDNPDDGVTFWAYNEDATTVRLRISTRHSSNPVLATAEVPLMSMNRANPTPLTGGLTVNIHNGPERPNNRHFSPEIYWLRPTPAAPVATAPWIIRIRNQGRSTCVIHGFCAFREHRGRFIFDPAQTQPLIGVTYTADQRRQFESHKVSTPGTANGTICVAAFTSRLGGFGTTVDELAPFSSPGPMRAVGPGQRVIDVALPGDPISSARAFATNPARGVVDMSGTSMASPMMAGIVAAMLQMNRHLTTAQIRTRIELAATRRPADSVDDWGLGRLDMSRIQT